MRVFDSNTVMPMSESQALSERDRQLLSTIDEEIEAADDSSDYERIARDLRDRFAEHRAEFRQFKHDTNRRLERLEENETGQAAVDDDAPLLVHYANIPEDDREDALSTSEQIALTLHCEWSDIAWTMGDSDNRKVGVDTKTKANAKYNPSRLRHRLKEKVGHDLQATEIYRGLKRLAILSGGEECVNAADNRVHVTGGWYEYREMTTADNQDVKRVVWKVKE